MKSFSDFTAKYLIGEISSAEQDRPYPGAQAALLVVMVGSVTHSMDLSVVGVLLYEHCVK